MRVDGVFVRGHGVHLPPLLPVRDALARGDCTAELVARTGIRSVAVSSSESAAEMAVEAARIALRRAGSGPDEVDLILHADTYHQGQDLWPAASYVQRETVRNGCLAVEIRQMSNGGMAAVELAVAHLLVRDGKDALLTTADRFCLPGIDRWRTDPGTPYGDGGTSLVLSRRGGYARLLSIATHADSDLEPLHRGDEPFGLAPFQHRMPVDFGAAKQAFLRDHGISFGVSRSVHGQQVVIERALHDADMDLPDAQWVVLPHFGYRRLHANYLRQYRIDEARTAWDWSRTIGHLGAGDQFAGLNFLLDSGRARAGDRCVLIGVGAGYSWGCAVIEICARPPWLDAPAAAAAELSRPDGTR